MVASWPAEPHLPRACAREPLNVEASAIIGLIPRKGPEGWCPNKLPEPRMC
jgi:hypothetical protein